MVKLKQEVKMVDERIISYIRFPLFLILMGQASMMALIALPSESRLLGAGMLSIFYGVMAGVIYFGSAGYGKNKK